ncbi:MAG: hypothetical protein ACJ8NS_08090 [Chthoniobacterales bacterium]
MAVPENIRPLSRNTKAHPVWDVYSELRTARLNVKCLQREIRNIRRKSRALEWILALSGTSSIGGFAFLQHNFGKVLWQVLGGVAVVIGAVKHLLPYAEERVKKERLLSSYSMLDNDLHVIAVRIKERRAYDERAREQFRIAMEHKKFLRAQNEGECAGRIKRRCENEVLNELPDKDFYIPG